MSGNLQPSTVFGARFLDALAYAVTLHAHDTRKGTNVPYAGHLLAVCSLTIDNGGDENEAIAALLHDAAEDHGGRPELERIRQRFGSRVAQIVERCSDSLAEDPHRKAPWRDRKVRYVETLRAHAAEGDEGALLVSAADKVSNLRSIAADAADPSVGERIFERFNGGKWGTLWYYRALADVFCAAGGKHRRLARELEALIAQLAGNFDARQLLARFDAARMAGAARANGGAAQ